MTVSLQNWPISADARAPLVEQIVSHCIAQIRHQRWPSGAKLPSIRALAAQYSISSFTVHNAYERLLAGGWLRSRPGAGYFVARDAQSAGASIEASAASSSLAAQVALMRQTLTHQEPGHLHVGRGTLPDSWLAEGELRRALRELARQGGSLTAYGTPQGYLPLRQQLSGRLAQWQIAASPAQILLTAGASQALDLVLRLMLKPGDAVLIDSPSFFNFHACLRLHGARLVSVPRTPQGPDLAALEAALAEHRPRLFLTNSVLHNPTGTSLTLPVAHRVLQLLAQYDCLAIEDDIYADFCESDSCRLAALDGLERVIYLGSFSKTLSANLRVGFVAASAQRIAALTDIKLITGMSTPQAIEQLVYRLLTGGQYRRHVDALRRRLSAAQAFVLPRLAELGCTPWAEPQGGYLAWVALPDGVSADALAEAAARHDIWLAPGRHFTLEDSAAGQLRVNMAHALDERFWQFLAAELTSIQRP
ncbi:PLP-dependent aminotransferase family protein [Crenobacter cavernae]|uniref:Putative 8-amino-7-oxononanoate synthase n=1 Tax=Crenobacter cavernae TaxID=2290923 RepID=A0A345Y6N6_9NEIS|nr:PLP-dependent aminotransferase family protein [Crenobacter cavernae]AXK39588.1 PLP-dependent aminotransferase family protein [Crenobacter cavernae]